VGASLRVIDADARRMRGKRLLVFTNLQSGRRRPNSCGAWASRTRMMRGPPAQCTTHHRIRCWPTH
jgi:hypothetical protein